MLGTAEHPPRPPPKGLVTVLLFLLGKADLQAEPSQGSPSAAVLEEVLTLTPGVLLGACSLRSCLFSYYCFSMDFPFRIFPFGFQNHSFSSEVLPFPGSFSLRLRLPTWLAMLRVCDLYKPGIPPPYSDNTAVIRAHLFQKVFIFAISLEPLN